MKAKINEGCIGCGVCELQCPEVFRVEDGVAVVYAGVTPETIEAAEEAAENCPVEVIEIEE